MALYSDTWFIINRAITDSLFPQQPRLHSEVPVAPASRIRAGGRRSEGGGGPCLPTTAWRDPLQILFAVLWNCLGVGCGGGGGRVGTVVFLRSHFPGSWRHLGRHFYRLLVYQPNFIWEENGFINFWGKLRQFFSNSSPLASDFVVIHKSVLLIMHFLTLRRYFFYNFWCFLGKLRKYFSYYVHDMYGKNRYSCAK